MNLMRSVRPLHLDVVLDFVRLNTVYLSQVPAQRRRLGLQTDPAGDLHLWYGIVGFCFGRLAQSTILAGISSRIGRSKATVARYRLVLSASGFEICKISALDALAPTVLDEFSNV
jgi:hypothetical protein